MGSHSTKSKHVSNNPGIPPGLDQCRIEWSKNFCLGTGEPNSGWPRGGTLYSVIANKWPELTHGRIVANMIHELGVRNLLFVLKANTGVMIVLPEAIYPGKVATLKQQFGEGTGAEDLLDSLDTLTPSMLQHGLEMEQAVARKSAGALHQEVTQLLKKIFVWTGTVCWLITWPSCIRTRTPRATPAPPLGNRATALSAVQQGAATRESAASPLDSCAASCFGWVCSACSAARQTLWILSSAPAV